METKKTLIRGCTGIFVGWSLSSIPFLIYWHVQVVALIPSAIGLVAGEVIVIAAVLIASKIQQRREMQAINNMARWAQEEGLY